MISIVGPYIGILLCFLSIVSRLQASPQPLVGETAVITTDIVGAVKNAVVPVLPDPVRPVIAYSKELSHVIVPSRDWPESRVSNTAVLSLLENAGVNCLILSLSPFNFSASDQYADGHYRQAGELRYLCAAGVRVKFILSRLQDPRVQGVSNGELLTAEGVVPVRVQFEYNDVPLHQVSFESSGKVTEIPIDAHISVFESQVVSAPGIFKFPPDIVLSPVVN